MPVISEGKGHSLLSCILSPPTTTTKGEYMEMVKFRWLLLSYGNGACSSDFVLFASLSKVENRMVE